MEKIRSLAGKYKQEFIEVYSNWRKVVNKPLNAVPDSRFTGTEIGQEQSGQVVENSLVVLLGGEYDPVIASSVGQVEQAEQIIHSAQELGVDQKRYRQIADFSREALADLDKRGIVRRPYFSQVAAAYDITRSWDNGEPLCGLFDDTGMGKTYTALMAYLAWSRVHPASKLIILAENKPLQRTLEEFRSLGISGREVFCWSAKELAGVSVEEKARELSFFRGSFVLLNYSSLRDQRVNRLIRAGRNPDVLAVDESHHIRERKNGKAVAERTSAIWQASTAVCKRGGKGLLMSATPTVHKTEELERWRKVWNMNTIPSVIRRREDYFEMPPISTTEIGVSGKMLDLPTSREAVRAYFYEQMVREGSTIASWFINQYLPDVLSCPSKRVVAYSPFVYEDRLTGTIGLHNIARSLQERGIRYELIFGDGTFAPDAVRNFFNKGQVLLASYGSGAESYTFNAPGLEVELVALLPPPFYYQLYQAISRVYRPIGTGNEEIKVIMPQVVAATGETSITQRMYELLKQAEEKNRQFSEQKSVWDQIVSLLENSVQVERPIERSAGELYLPHPHRIAGKVQPDQAYLEFPPALDDTELAALLTRLKVGKDPQALTAIYSGIQGRTYALIKRYFGHISPENFDDVAQEIIGLELPGFIREYAAAPVDQVQFDLFLARRVIETGRSVLKTNIQNAISLEEPFSEDTPFALRDILRDPLSVDDLVLRDGSQDFSDVMQEALEWSVANEIILNREKVVLELRFGLNGNLKYTCEQIGKRFGVSRSRIQQLEASALRKLRSSPEFIEKINP